jgi:hypothetical protein
LKVVGPAAFGYPEVTFTPMPSSKNKEEKK